MNEYKRYKCAGAEHLKKVEKASRFVLDEVPDILVRCNVLAFSYLAEANLWHKTTDTLTSEGIAAYLQRFLWRSCDSVAIKDGMLTICFKPFQIWGDSNEFNPNSDLGSILYCNGANLCMRPTPLVTTTFNNFVASIPNLQVVGNFNPNRPTNWYEAVYCDCEGNEFNAKVQMHAGKTHTYGYLVDFCFSVEIEVPVAYFRKEVPRIHDDASEASIATFAYNLARFLHPKGVKPGANVMDVLSTCRLYNPFIRFFGTNYNSNNTIIAAHWYPRFKPIEATKNNELIVYYASDYLEPLKVSAQDLDIFSKSLNRKVCRLPFFCPIPAFSNREFNKAALDEGTISKYADIENFIFKLAQ